ncbi:MAG: hypothetical protein WBB89_00705 [Candidatus Acidiferrum sp.]
MGELLFELLLAFAELFLEVLLEFAGEALLDLALRVVAEVFESFRVAGPVIASVGYTLLGALAGGFSLVIFPHPLVHPSRLHGINLLVSPAVTGLVMSLIGSTLSRQGKKVTQIESFRYGFAFAFGMALIRYLFLV